MGKTGAQDSNESLIVMFQLHIQPFLWKRHSWNRVLHEPEKVMTAMVAHKDVCEWVLVKGLVNNKRECEVKESFGGATRDRSGLL